MRMRRTFSIFTMLCMAFMLSAQSQQSQSLGVQLGFAESVLRDNTVSHTKKLDNVTISDGLKVGLIYDATLIKGFGMSMAINYAFTMDAGKWVIENEMYVAKKIRTARMLHTIELPIEWQYKFKIATDTWLIAYTGPNLQYNFAFKETITRRNDATGQTSEDKNKHYDVDADGDGNSDYSRFNIQWGVGAGFQYQNYYIRGGYNFGIYNHFRDNYNDTGAYSNRARFDEWSIRLGIYFLNF